MAYLGEEIGKLGFGLMRLPRKDDAIDVEQVKAMVDKFMAAGFTYFDTAWAYTGSEDAIRQALVERYPRESFQLATKCAAWMGDRTKEGSLRQFDQSLERTGAGYFDFYLLHNIGEHKTHFFEDFGIWDFVAKKKEEGLIKHFGFSFHSKPEELDEVLTKHPEAEFVQLQINYADWENPAFSARGCYEVARKHNKPIVIMEPVKGGLLANPPERVAEILHAADPAHSAASWAIRFAADLEGVITVLSGMSTLEQMEDNLSYMKDFKRLTPEERETVEKARIALTDIPLIPCTTCNYCAKVCPMDIGISGTFTAMNMLTLYNERREAEFQANWLVGGHGHKHASECIQCGQCEEVCPQHISIRDELQKGAELFPPMAMPSK
ncbi:MAG: aldo/keto reductase [Oscillospiraceae bacterium]|nr:aldo/keto reductase [Oscillospiraceae bacterium]